jgi:outer membrane protein
MKKVFTLVVALVSIAMVSTTQAQKIAVVSADEIFNVMPEKMKADTSMALYQQALADSYTEMEQEVSAAYEKFVKDSSKMTKEVKDNKKENLQKKIAELQGGQEAMQQKMEAKRAELVRPIQDRMIKTIQDVAKEKGFAYVMYKEQLVMFPEADDITAAVKAKLGIKK